MTSASDQRIRHVAIVLQSLDAATSRGLLSQLPSPQSKRVRQAMVQMGTITPQERAAAFQSMKGLLNVAGVRTIPPRSTSRETLSPAAALLASQQSAMNDHVELSHEAIQQQAPQHNQYQQNLSDDEDGSWRHMPAEALAEILQGERPIVIATVINQVSVERATAISQALPMQVAAATLASLPNLHLADAEFLRDIQLELERKIGLYQTPKKVNAEGISKLQAIVASMPTSQQDLWTRAIAQSNPVLGSKLGWSSMDNPFASSANIATATSSKTGESAFETSLPSASLRVTPSVHFENEETFEPAMVLPFRPNSKAHSANKQTVALESGSAMDANGRQNLTIQDLLQFSDSDFVTVLHACEPDTVLLALSGATKPFIKRVERLISSKDVKRLRKRLNTLGPIQLRDVDAAQRQISDTAMQMFESGLVGSTASVSFTAAA